MRTQRRSFGRILRLGVGLVMLLASGCMVGPNFHPPQPTKVPDSWAGVEKTPSTPSSATAADTSGLTRWWYQFHDPMLVRLVEEGLKANLDLQLSEARLRQARAARGMAVGGFWPTVAASASYQRQHTPGPTRTGLDQDLYQSGFDAVWELDLFGGVRRQIESADATIQASMDSLRDVQVSLIAEVAVNYIQLRGYQQEIVITQDNLKAQQHTAEIMHQRLTAGFVSALDVANADASVATTESQLPVLETSAQQSIYALSVLLARPPADLLEQLKPTGKLPDVPAEVPAGLPSELLRRRPDIRQAEAQLHAATAQIGVATADLFPKFSLTGSVSWQSNLLRTQWTESSRISLFGPSLTWPIFQGGAIRSNIRVQEALRDQAFITYQKTVLNAFQEVENALIAFSKEQRHRKSLSNAVIANRKAMDLSLKLYRQGMTDFLNVLIAQRSLYASEDALAQSNRDIAMDLIALYKALGNGWESAPTNAEASTSAPADAKTAER